MPLDRPKWLNPFSIKSIPLFECPSCQKGSLRVFKKSVSVLQTAHTNRLLRTELGLHDSSEFDARYSMLLKCDNKNCQESVASCGFIFYQIDYEYRDNEKYPQEIYIEMCIPHYFFPELFIFPIPDRCPENVAAEIKNSFKLFFADPPASANSVRKAVEAILTHQGIGRENTLHKRIETYAQTNSTVAEMLFAIKWIGNEGSHSGDIKKNDLLDAYEILEFILDELYVGYRNQVNKKK